MDNPSLIELASQLSERLTPLGLHLSADPMIAGGVKADEFPDDDSDEEDETPPSMEDLINGIKSENAFAMINMTFTFNELVWTDRILDPSSHMSPEMVADLDGIVESRGEVIARRLADGEDIDAIMNELVGDDDDEE